MLEHPHSRCSNSSSPIGFSMRSSFPGNAIWRGVININNNARPIILFRIGRGGQLVLTTYNYESSQAMPPAVASDSGAFEVPIRELD